VPEHEPHSAHRSGKVFRAILTAFGLIVLVVGVALLPSSIAAAEGHGNSSRLLLPVGMIVVGGYLFGVGLRLLALASIRKR
jgi:uncharacterized membrane protein YedE/YeeE